MGQSQQPMNIINMFVGCCKFIVYSLLYNEYIINWELVTVWAKCCTLTHSIFW